MDLTYVKRFLRTVVPQIPAAVVYIQQFSGAWNLPEWVAPTLVFVGAVATALDKWFRDIKFYDRFSK